MEANVYLNRMEKVRQGMAKADFDVFLVSPSSNLFYLTGYGRNEDERLCLLVLPLEGPPFVIENILYKEQAKSLPVDDFIYWKDGDDPYSLLKVEIEKRRIPMRKAALEPQIPALFSLPISRSFPATVFELGSSVTDPLRQQKDESELELIRRACRASDRALTALIEKGAYWLGKTEADFFDALSSEFSRAGMGSFGAGIAAGANAAVPHHHTGKTVIEKGKCFLADFWARLDGYFTDCTRTFHFGRPEKEFEDVYAIVLEAHLAAEAKSRVGNTLGDVDLAARSVIEKHGYAEYFTHRTGHGLGIDVHEGGSVNKGVNVPIAPGMVFSIEPGIYLPGRFGVRIENLVAVGENGAEALHSYPRELRIIE